MPRKPDRFERVVNTELVKLNKDKRTAGFRCGGCMEYVVVIKLLRKEHRWVERMVATIAPDYESARGFRRVILQQLKQRRK